jgi:pSer/pThr/pTyr-binding forkhead associated (FHA) protein
MGAQIQVLLGPDRGKLFRVEAGATLQIGRSEASDTQLTDASVSRLHCHLDYDGKRGVLTNISTKGTLVNGKAIEGEKELRHGDIIRVGVTELRYALVALAEAETLSQPPG